jgi:hypothetical protein
MTTGCVADRLDALRRLRAAGLRAFAVVPLALPMDPARLIDAVAPCVRSVRIDRMHAGERARPLRARASGLGAMTSRQRWWTLGPGGFTARGGRVDACDDRAAARD